MERVWVIPAEGLQVRDPFTRKILPPEGEEKNLDSFWERRRLEGDVTYRDPAKVLGEDFVQSQKDAKAAADAKPAATPKKDR